MPPSLGLLDEANTEPQLVWTATEYKSSESEFKLKGATLAVI